MIVELTKQQRSAVHESETPVRFVDPETNEAFVLLRLETYERLRGMLVDEFHPSQAYSAMDRTFAEGWNDPKMDDYDHYENFRR